MTIRFDGHQFDHLIRRCEVCGQDHVVLEHPGAADPLKRQFRPEELGYYVYLTRKGDQALSDL